MAHDTGKRHVEAGHSSSPYSLAYSPPKLVDSCFGSQSLQAAVLYADNDIQSYHVLALRGTIGSQGAGEAVKSSSG
ncbi:hypothetical protein A0H81_11121 [Grifola frondosa]|uniref:Uncharacterized protein n=1 Tax=Grifola frondosa TaxID=5627 RepID=A0A1C7LW99_GRIFR|nr:hypothetical protein A0H81_11121 [Grifola frondosa]